MDMLKRSFLSVIEETVTAHFTAVWNAKILKCYFLFWGRFNNPGLRDCAAYTLLKIFYCDLSVYFLIPFSPAVTHAPSLVSIFVACDIAIRTGAKLRTLKFGGGRGRVNIHIFVFCLTNFFWNQLFFSSFQKKLVGQNTNIWIFTRPNNALVSPWIRSWKLQTLHSMAVPYCTLKSPLFLWQNTPDAD